MDPSIDAEQVFKPVDTFSCGPSAATHTLNIVPNHGASMVQREQGIKAPALELPLSDHAATAAFMGLVSHSTFEYFSY